MKSTLSVMTALLFTAVLTLTSCSSAKTPPQQPKPPVEQQQQEQPQEKPAEEPAEPAELTTTEKAKQLVADFSLEQRVASLIMAHLPGIDAQYLSNFLNRTELGGFIFMPANIPDSSAELASLASDLQGNDSFPRFLAVDQEGGVVSRLFWDQNLSAIELKYADADATFSAFTERAKLIKEAGINTNFGIVADVTDDPYSFIFDRALATTFTAAANSVAAAVEAEKGTVFSTIKHFPGHGEAPGDSHWGLPETSLSYADWRLGAALPFESGIAAGTEMVMFGHLVYNDVDHKPASLSAAWHEILRNDLGFGGIAVTDDLNMLLDSGFIEYSDPIENAIAALKAGNDMLLFVSRVDEALLEEMVRRISAAAENDPALNARITESAIRLAELRLS